MHVAMKNGSSAQRLAASKVWAEIKGETQVLLLVGAQRLAASKVWAAVIGKECVCR